MGRGRRSVVGWVVLVLFVFGVVAGTCSADGLIVGFYSDSCPFVEDIVRIITWEQVAANASLAAKLLRIHYHDCFVRGCDASILLDPVGDQQTEKQAIPNLSLSGYEVYDMIKDLLELVCPGVVSCADVVALAARDAVSFQFGFSLWEVPTGRRDGVVSIASEALTNLPSPFSNFTALKRSFASKGLDLTDLVALSGAHTIGVAHCGAFSRRLYNFTGKGDADPSLDPTYANFLRKKCPNPANPATIVEMDPSSSLNFDTHYFTAVIQNKGLFQSDAALLTNPTTSGTVRQLLNSDSFFSQFGVSMQHMGAADVLTGSKGEIRQQCRVVNSNGDIRASA